MVYTLKILSYSNRKQIRLLFVFTKENILERQEITYTCLFLYLKSCCSTPFGRTRKTIEKSSHNSELWVQGQDNIRATAAPLFSVIFINPATSQGMEKIE